MHTDSVTLIIVAVISATGTLLTAVVGILLTYWLSHVKRQVEKIEIATNSMKDALVKATAEASLAQGKAEGTALEQRRVQDMKDKADGWTGPPG